MTTDLATARRTSPAFHRATLPALVAATLLLGACGDDDSTTEPEVLPPIGNGESPSPEGVPGTGAPLSPGEGAGDPGTGEDPPPEDDPPAPGTGDALPPEGGDPNGEGTDVVETLDGQDDREGLRVRFPGDADPASLESPWLAVIDVFQNAPFPDTTGDLYVDLVRYTPDLAFERHVEFYTPELDTCVVQEPDDSEGGEEEEDVDDGRRSVSGGDAVTLSSAGGEWLRVPFSRDILAYDHDDGGFPGPIPEDLTLSLPGSEFPAVDALPLGLPAPPLRLSPPIGEAVTPETEYRWTPTDDGSIPRLVFKHFVDGEFQGFPVSCRLRDDGAFELPEDVLDALAALPGEKTVRYVRELNLLEFRDGIAMFQSVDIVDD